MVQQLRSIQHVLIHYVHFRDVRIQQQRTITHLLPQMMVLVHLHVQRHHTQRTLMQVLVLSAMLDGYGMQVEHHQDLQVLVMTLQVEVTICTMKHHLVIHQMLH